jgi:hypothetical protein
LFFKAFNPMKYFLVTFGQVTFGQMTFGQMTFVPMTFGQTTIGQMTFVQITHGFGRGTLTKGKEGSEQLTSLYQLV